MNVAIRTKKLKALLDLRIGPGAALLPNEVKRIHLDFALRMNGGHLGPRKFWRQCLPRLKYHNPAISMTVNRTEDQAGSATLSIFFAPHQNTDSPTALPASDSTTNPTNPSAHDSFDRMESIDIKNVHSSEILKRFLDVTKARLYEASVEEKAELREVKVFNERSQADREAQDRLNKARAQEQAILEQARRAVS